MLEATKPISNPSSEGHLSSTSTYFLWRVKATEHVTLATHYAPAIVT